ncbi:MAG TPA: hypothetical protein VKT99_22025 [Xanthobacteraceae bacterium]|jgi:hypothetical protein|nr:hypothetical protein [Xanthobacteraceae bacterium]
MTDCKIAPKIEAEHRSEVYHATPDELRALDDAEMSSVASEEERLMEKLHATPPADSISDLACRW